MISGYLIRILVSTSTIPSHCRTIPVSSPPFRVTVPSWYNILVPEVGHCSAQGSRYYWGSGYGHSYHVSMVRRSDINWRSAVYPVGSDRGYGRYRAPVRAAHHVRRQTGIVVGLIHSRNRAGFVGIVNRVT